MAETGEKEPGNKQQGKSEKVGEVVSAKMAKTIVVEVTRRVPHPLYKRIVTKRKKFYAHDETREAKLGDVVRIAGCRPMSRLKRWKLEAVVRKAVEVKVDTSAIDMAPSAEAPPKKGGTKSRRRS